MTKHNFQNFGRPGRAEAERITPKNNKNSDRKEKKEKRKRPFTEELLVGFFLKPL